MLSPAQQESRSEQICLGTVSHLFRAKVVLESGCLVLTLGGGKALGRSQTHCATPYIPHKLCSYCTVA